MITLVSCFNVLLINLSLYQSNIVAIFDFLFLQILFWTKLIQCHGKLVHVLLCNIFFVFSLSLPLLYKNWQLARAQHPGFEIYLLAVSKGEPRTLQRQRREFPIWGRCFQEWRTQPVAQSLCGVSPRHVVVERQNWNWNYYLVLVFTLAQSEAWLTLRLLFKLPQRLRRVSCFINKQSESIEILSSYFRCFAGSTNKDCVSSIARTLWAMKGK